MGQRSEIVGYTLSKVEDARLDRWTRVGYAKQVVGRAGTKGALTILYRCKSVGFCEITQIQHPGVLSVSKKLALSWSPMRYGDEEETCMVYQVEYPPQGNCKSVVEAFFIAQFLCKWIQSQCVPEFGGNGTSTICSTIRLAWMENEMCCPLT